MCLISINEENVSSLGINLQSHYALSSSDETKDMIVSLSEDMRELGKRSVIETHSIQKCIQSKNFQKTVVTGFPKKSHFSKSCIIIIEWLGIFLIKKKKSLFWETYIPASPCPSRGGWGRLRARRQPG